ncbi:MAG TPA: transporter associated domain-containing protein [Burkholderiaceae bacterium]|nr:transporter associated domain-containing protein [Burkholderiaceae bacterium]
MSDDPSGESRRPLFERLATLLLRIPEDREQLLDVMRQAHDRSLLDSEALSMIEGVLQVSELSAGDIMVSRSQMDVLDVNQSIAELLPQVIAAAHSRFPVIDGNRDNVVGILHAKELLRGCVNGSVGLQDLIRPPLFIPESKRLNVLLREFRQNHEHLAIVVDEYGGTAGLITIEDILEQIVGDIEDEFDVDDEVDHIVPVEADGAGDGLNGAVHQASERHDGLEAGCRRWRVRGIASLRLLNEVAGTQLSDEDVETVGGLVIDRLGRVPRQGERLEIDGLAFEVLRADPRQIQVLMVEQTLLQALDERADAR